eukprot:3395332-Pyramimonas_sp.AAC.1
MLGTSEFDAKERCRPFLPLWALSWRRSADALVRRRNPIFSDVTWFVPSMVIPMDWLHLCSLGIFKVFVSILLHKMFECNALDVAPGPHDVFIANCVAKLRALLFDWHDTEKQAGRDHTRVQNLTVEMVGHS